MKNAGCRDSIYTLFPFSANGGMADPSAPPLHPRIFDFRLFYGAVAASSQVR